MSFMKQYLNRIMHKFKPFEWLAQFVFVLTCIFLFFNPFPHTTAIKEICFYLNLFIITVLIFAKNKNFTLQSPLSIPFGLFVLWSFIGLFFAVNKANSIHDFGVHLLKYLIVYYTIINFFNSKKRFLHLAWVMIISVTIFCLWEMITFYVFFNNDLRTRFLIDARTLYLPYLEFSYEFAFILAAFITLRYQQLYKRLFTAFCLATVSSAIILTQTRSAYISILISSIFLFHRSIKKIFIIFIIFAVILFFSPMQSRLSESIFTWHNIRITTWLNFSEMIKDHPIMGIGFGMQSYHNIDFVAKYAKRVPPAFRGTGEIVVTPHNFILDIAVRVGLVGFFLFLYILFTFSKMWWQTIRHSKDDFIKGWGLAVMSAFIAFIVQGMYADAGFGNQAIVMYTIFAMMTILWRLQYSPSSPQDGEINSAMSTHKV
jgi:O-antigen ligase